MTRTGLFWVGLALLAAMPVRAEITASDKGGFVSTHSLTLAVPAADVWRALTVDVGRWWDPAHSHSGAAENFNLDLRAGGCFCESLPGGGSVEHMRVIFAKPGRLLRLAGALGPLQALAVSGSMTFALTELAPARTRLDYTYAVSGYVPGGLDAYAEPVDTVQGAQLERLAAYLSQGAQGESSASSEGTGKTGEADE